MFYECYKCVNIKQVMWVSNFVLKVANVHFCEDVIERMGYVYLYCRKDLECTYGNKDYWLREDGSQRYPGNLIKDVLPMGDEYFGFDENELE